jgi:hypothetical protein
VRTEIEEFRLREAKRISDIGKGIGCSYVHTPLYVYFIQGLERGYIKIGHTWNPQRRFKQLESAVWEKFTVWAVIPGDRQLETFLHRKFKQHQVRGEWFHAHEDVLQYIRDMREQFGVYQP